MKIKPNSRSPTTSICFNTGALANLINKEQVTKQAKNLQQKNVKLYNIASVALQTSITQQVEFDFYILGRIRGTPVNSYFYIYTNVIKNLRLKLLLGIGFIIQNRVKINVIQKRCNLQSTFNITVEVEVMTARALLLRKVQLAMAVELHPGQEAQILVMYLDLPRLPEGAKSKTKTYYLMTSTLGCLNAIVTTNSEKVILIHNNRRKPICLYRHKKVSYITLYIRDKNFKTALLAIVRKAQKADPNNLDKDKQAIVAYYKLLDKRTALGALRTNNKEGIPEAPNKLPEKPKFYTPSYSIEKLDNLLAIKSAIGVSVCSKDPKFIEQVKVLLDRYKVFYNQGIALMLEDQKIKIYLVEGQQKQLQLAKSYSLGREDKDFLDVEHNKLHAQGRISFLDKPTLIVYLVFIVQRLVNSKKKGQVIVNLQLVNAVTILDIYPLLDQDDIIGDLTGKKWLTVFNAIGFFY